MSRRFQCLLAIAGGLAVCALGFAALSAGDRLRGLEIETEAYNDAVGIVTDVQERLLVLREQLASWPLPLDDEHAFVDSGNPATLDESILWRFDGTLDAVPANALDDVTLVRQLQRITGPGVHAPLTSTNGRDLVLVAVPRGDAWLGATVPADTLIAANNSRALVLESLELARGSAENGRSLFRVSYDGTPRRHTLAFPVPGGNWRLNYNDTGGLQRDGMRWSLYGAVLLIGYLAALLLYRLGTRPRMLGEELQHLMDRFNRQNADLRQLLENRDQAEDRIHQLVITDAESGLPNRQAFIEHLEQVLANLRSTPERGHVSVVVAGLRDLEAAAHTLGHTVAASILPKVARRIGEQFDGDLYVARINTCQLALLLTGCDARQAIQRIADLASSAVTGLYEHEAGNLNVAPRFGIAAASDGYTYAEQLVDEGVSALSDAESGGTRWSMFETENRDDRVTRIQLSSDFRSAIDNSEFRLYYQPIVHTHSGKPKGFECLVRWQHPVEGLLPPGRFIALCESAGLVNELTMWGLREAVRQAQAWENLQRLGCYLSVNLSTLDLLYAPLADELSAMVRDAGLTPATFRLEITESTLINNMAQSRDMLHQLRDAGFGIMMDDFGTGFSSLSYLRQLPFTAIKIDRSFTQAITWDSKNYGMVRNILNLVHFLEMETIIEGVETTEQHELLMPLDPVYCQGYLFARPMPAIDAEEYLAAATLAPRALIAAT